MKKKIAVLVLTLAVLGLAAGCGSKKEENKKASGSESAQEFVLTNEEGKVVAIDEKDMEKYVTLGNYKNLEVETEPMRAVTEEDVDTFIELTMVNKYAPVEVTEDRAVQKNDTVNIDYAGYKDGVAFEGGTAKGTDLIIGSGGFIDGFEDGLIGHKKGEEVTLDLTFPEDYRAPELQGQAVQFKVKINKISEPQKLTDEWAKENTDYQTAAEYRDAQKKFLEEDAKGEYDGILKSNLFRMVLENSKIKDYPKKDMEEMKKQVRRQLNELYLSRAGVSLDEYVKSQNMPKEEVEKNIEAAAKEYMNQNLIVQAVLDAEGIELTEKDYEKEKEKFAKESGFPDAAAMEKLYTDKSVIKNNVLWNRVCEVFLETATVKETEKTDSVN